MEKIYILLSENNNGSLRVRSTFTAKSKAINGIQDCIDYDTRFLDEEDLESFRHTDVITDQYRLDSLDILGSKVVAYDRVYDIDSNKTFIKYYIIEVILI